MKINTNKNISSSEKYPKQLSAPLLLDSGNSSAKKTVDQKAEKQNFLTLADIAKHSPFSKSYLAMAAREGKLQARKVNEVWYTTREGLSEFEKEMKSKKDEYRNVLSKNLEGVEPKKDENEKAKRKTEPEKIQSGEISQQKSVFRGIEKTNGKETVEMRGERKGFARKLFPFLLRSGFIVVMTLFILSLISFVNDNFSARKFYPDAFVINDSSNRGVVMGDETPDNSSQNTEMFSSEHFLFAQVTFGGDVAIAQEEMGELDISEIKSELVTSKNKKDIQLLVSWKTSKSAICEIDYGKSGGALEKVKKEEKYSFAHSMILPALEPATAYSFVIKAKDKLGSEKTSDKFAFYTGAPDVSLIDLLTGAARETFGWAIGK